MQFLNAIGHATHLKWSFLVIKCSHIVLGFIILRKFGWSYLPRITRAAFISLISLLNFCLPSAKFNGRWNWRNLICHVKARLDVTCGHSGVFKLGHWISQIQIDRGIEHEATDDRPSRYAPAYKFWNVKRPSEIILCIFL